MKKHYEFIEGEKFYDLVLNGLIVVRSFSKRKYSKQEAEDKAGDEVNKAIIKYGFDKVEYNGWFANAVNQ